MYLKTWMGKTSGSHLGRDDGYPERKFRLIKTIDELVRTYDGEAEYYRLEKIDVSGAVSAFYELGK